VTITSAACRDYRRLRRNRRNQAASSAASRINSCGSFKLGPAFVFSYRHSAGRLRGVRYPMPFTGIRLFTHHAVAHRIIGIRTHIRTHASNTLNPCGIGRRIKHPMQGGDAAAFSGDSLDSAISARCCRSFTATEPLCAHVSMADHSRCPAIA